MTFSEKETKMTFQLHISKFEILSLSNKVHENSDFLSLMWHGTIFWTEKAMKYFVFVDFNEETKDFKFWNVEIGCYFYSFLRKTIQTDFLSLFWTEKAMKFFLFANFIEETKDFKFWNVELGCHICSFLRKSHLYWNFSFVYICCETNLKY